MKKRILVVALLLITLSQVACSNKRLYIGMDDYGEPKEFQHNFTTRGHDDGDRSLGKPSKY